jgi:hypothetical protein
MIEKTFKTVKVTEETVEAVVCDKCKRRTIKDDYAEFQEYHHIHFTGGYGSIFGDGITVKVDLCQHCLYEMVKGLGIQSVID